MTLLTDTGTIFGRYLRATLRSKTSLVFGMLQPLLFLALFGPLLTGLDLGVSGSSWQTLVPGVLVQLTLLGGSFVGLGLLVDRSLGVIDRMRVTPVHPMALLLGRTLRDVVQLVAQSVLLVLLGLLLGLRAPLPGVLIGLVFVAVLAGALSALSYGLAMNVRSTPEFAAVANTVGMPLMLLSGLLLPMNLAPGWLNGVSLAIPLRYAVDAMREVFQGHYLNGTVAAGAAATAVLAAACLFGGTRLFQRGHA
ncbi:ABC transporter permease [Marinitenerispora sediminis]|uniref:Transport permease protein n=1 Tax=Marinitenerispora sediminis TaxID=1931232 RepID=A0A368T9N4_9ACTN|nr:ABC transporter permease [Marinitenerispora sediminis]RCV49015.1 multidrug ABC transporter permease [Marinitenerispora sediminis]RCV51739.1 multidrug ABC transporter permease [Marinitenerispora sediminis]RCV60963.1 multidrug ABC transporter permease [Marinitenerispora sediminis]